MICSALGWRCSRWTLPGGNSDERRMILRAPVASLLMTLLTIKPSWSGLVMTSAVASRTFLISTVLLSQMSTGPPCSAHDEQHPTGHLAVLDPSVGRSRLLQRVPFGDRRSAQGSLVEARTQVLQYGGALFGVQERSHEPEEAQPLAVEVEQVEGDLLHAGG